MDTLKNKVRSVFSPYKGRFQDKRDRNNHLLGTLYSAEGGALSSMSLPPPPTMVTHQRKDYNYLKPAILSSDCTRRELSKFSSDCSIWLEKSLSPDDRSDTRLVWASVRAVIDDEWAEVLSRDENIGNRELEEIHRMMDRIFLERNPLIVQRLSALRIQKLKEEPVSECLRKIFDAYQSAELKNCPLETLALLHLVTLLPADPLSDRIKAHLVEKMRIEPNITSLEEITTYILSQEADDVAKKSTFQQASRVNQVTESEKDSEKKKFKYRCRTCSKVHERYACQYVCEFCGKKGHKEQSCWYKNPKQAPQGGPPQTSLSLPNSGKDKREPTPGPQGGRGGRSRRRSKSSGRRSDRGSSFERSASEPESPAAKGPRKRHRSNRILICHPTESTPSGLTESVLSDPSGQMGFPQNQLFPEDPLPAAPRRVNRIKYQGGVSSNSTTSSSSCKKSPKSKVCLFDETELPEATISSEVE